MIRRTTALLLAAATLGVPALAASHKPKKMCAAQPVQDLIGRTRSGAVERDAKRRAGARSIRWIGIDDAVTMDYRPERLNLRLGPDGTIAGVNCG